MTRAEYEAWRKRRGDALTALEEDAWERAGKPERP
jgi:hypothetical protein